MTPPGRAAEPLTLGLARIASMQHESVINSSVFFKNISNVEFFSAQFTIMLFLCVYQINFVCVILTTVFAVMTFKNRWICLRLQAKKNRR